MRTDPTHFLSDPPTACVQGIRLQSSSAAGLEQDRQTFFEQLEDLGLRQCVEFAVARPGAHGIFEGRFQPRADLARIWAPGLDTTRLHLHLTLDMTPSGDDLTREIVVAMLLSPLAFYATTSRPPRARRRWPFTPARPSGRATAGATWKARALCSNPAAR